jgi:hypothetical protein
MLLHILWVIAVSAAVVVFFVFYLAFAYLLFSPLLDYLIEKAFRRRPAAWASRAKASSRNGIGSRYVSGRTRAWLKTKNPNFVRWKNPNFVR